MVSSGYESSILSGAPLWVNVPQAGTQSKDSYNRNNEKDPLRITGRSLRATTSSQLIASGAPAPFLTFSEIGYRSGDGDRHIAIARRVETDFSIFTHQGVHAENRSRTDVTLTLNNSTKR